HPTHPRTEDDMQRDAPTPSATIRRRWKVALAVAAAVITGATVSAPSLLAPSGAGAATTADCSAGKVLTVVAHADDDLLFEGTELRKDIDADKCVRSVIVTAGDAGKSATYWKGRQTGLEAAYANLAGVTSAWTSGSVSAGGKTVVTRTLTADPRLSLVYLQLPDGNIDGSGFAATRYQSLQKLYQRSITSMSTVSGATYGTTYTLAQLQATVLALMTGYGPQEVHTLDHVGTYGDGDHSDHHTVAYLTKSAQQQLTTASTLTGYMGYPIADKPSNLTAAQTQAKGNAFFAYSAYDAETCASVASCSSRPEGSWLSREYTVGTQTPTDPGTGSGGSVGADVTAGAAVTASSENPADGQTAVKAVDGVASGYPDAPTAEWATRGGGTGSWLQLAWSSAVTLGAVDLADRPNADDQVTAGTLTFSDGSSVAVPTLDNGGAFTRVTFSSRQVSWVKFTVTGVSATTRNVGLAEIRTFAPGSTTPTPGRIRI
ncbi:PIG-L family deacetylase, partial [Curtobacterium sp. CT11-45]|uniref:DUF7402 domain-containing protein n=1 Tax=Curtobacterium sp. CT11-45 TaxID=3243037 RepID=UPI0039AF6D14